MKWLVIGLCLLPLVFCLFSQSLVTGAAFRGRVLLGRVLRRAGLRDDSFLLIIAVLIGVIAAIAAVSFKELIDGIRELLYGHFGQHMDLFGNGAWLLIVIPAAGGLTVGIIKRLMGAHDGHGIVDVMESVMRSSGTIRPRVAVEQILCSGVTIGSGGSTGAEGPIVEIGAALASAVGKLFRLSRQHMPVILGCGAAAGISAIFNAPIGGVLFTLELILRDFSIRTFVPIVVASVIANSATKAIFEYLAHFHHPIIGAEPYAAIFDVKQVLGDTVPNIEFSQMGNFVALGLICGLVAVAFTHTMRWMEPVFKNLKLPRMLKPAIGGALLGLIGVVYIVLFGWLLFNQDKPIAAYELPAFFSDGYGAIMEMLRPTFYQSESLWKLFLLLGFLGIAKIVGTALTVGSGGGGGVIAPSLFLGAVTGGLLGLALQSIGLFANVEPHVYALVGMAGVLAAVIHAPLAAILILSEVTRSHELVLPTMLTAVVATSLARHIYRDSLYTAGLRSRGVQVGTSADLSLLRRLSVEQVALEPATTIAANAPVEKLLHLVEQHHGTDFVVVNEDGTYAGIVTTDDINTALIQREATPLLLVAELMRSEVKPVRTTDDLAYVMDRFSLHDIGRLPVVIPGGTGKVVGMVSRSTLMRSYQQALTER